MKNKLVMLVASLTLAMATVAFAGNKGGAFSVSPVIGGITFEGDRKLETSPLFGARIGYNFTDALGIEALFDYTKARSTEIANTMDFYRYGGELLYHFMPDKKFVPYFAAGFAGMKFNEQTNKIGEKATEVYDYGLGAKYFVTEDVAWRADVRHLVSNDYQAVEYTIGLYIPIGGAPPIAKLADPPPAPAPVVKEFAPLPPTAPLAGLSALPASIDRGQSSTLSWVSQNATTCDIQPGIGAVQLKGSMPVKPDNNTQYTLLCKGEGGTAKSTANVEVRAITPPPVPAPVPKAVAAKAAAAERFCNKPAILMINFDTDKHNIKPQYHNELKTVGDFLKFFPDSKGEIAGHTDSTASNAYNQKLSERRANSVKDYIIKNFGIAPDRIKSKGYGEEKPIATNKTIEGRAKNRRIVANFTCD